MHGFAFNINTDLRYFKKIVPCGICESTLSVTSVGNEIGRRVDMKKIKEIHKKEMSEVLHFQYK